MKNIGDFLVVVVMVIRLNGLHKCYLLDCKYVQFLLYSFAVKLIHLMLFSETVLP